MSDSQEASRSPFLAENEYMDEYEETVRLKRPYSDPMQQQQQMSGEEYMEEGVQPNYKRRRMNPESESNEEEVEAANRPPRKRLNFNLRATKRLIHVPPGEYTMPPLNTVRAEIYMLRAMKKKNARPEDLWDKEALLRSEGWALTSGADKLPDEYHSGDDERPVSPMNDECRALEEQIVRYKLNYREARTALLEYGEIHRVQLAPIVTKEFLESLEYETRKSKVILKLALEQRNEIRGFTEEELKERRKAKLRRKLEEREEQKEIIDILFPDRPSPSSSAEEDDFQYEHEDDEEGGGGGMGAEDGDEAEAEDDDDDDSEGGEGEDEPMEGEGEAMSPDPVDDDEPNIDSIDDMEHSGADGTADVVIIDP